MGTEFRKGVPPREIVEAAEKRGLHWITNDGARIKLSVRNGVIVCCMYGPFCSLEQMTLVSNTLGNSELRPVGGLQDRNLSALDASLIDWTTLEMPRTQPSRGDIVTLLPYQDAHLPTCPTQYVNNQATVTAVLGNGNVEVQRGFHVIVWPSRAVSQVGVGVTATSAFKPGDRVVLQRYAYNTDNYGWLEHEATLVDKTAVLVEAHNGGEGFRVEIEGHITVWPRSAMSLAPAPTTPSVDDVAFRPFAEITKEMIAAHKGEWASAGRRWLFELRDGQVLADWKDHNHDWDAMLTYAHHYTEQHSFRAVDTALKSIPWIMIEALVAEMKARSMPSITFQLVHLTSQTRQSAFSIVLHQYPNLSRRTLCPP